MYWHTNDLKPAASDSIRAAYDGIAAGYNASMAQSHWIRRRLWRRLDGYLQPGARALDVTAGTGLDCLYLAGRGIEVVACDVSPKMLGELSRQNSAIETHVMDFNALDMARLGMFDVVLSTFAGLNTTPDLSAFAQNTSRLLKQNGLLFLHMLNRLPALEWLTLIGRGQFRKFWRAARLGTLAVTIGGQTVNHYLFSAPKVYRRYFERHFYLAHCAGQVVVRPAGRHDVDWLEGIDHWLGGAPLVQHCGTFVTLELRRR